MTKFKLGQFVIHEYKIAIVKGIKYDKAQDIFNEASPMYTIEYEDDFGGLSKVKTVGRVKENELEEWRDDKTK